MKRILAIVLASGVVLLLGPSRPAMADPYGVCPDGQYLFPAASVDKGQQTDKNGDGLICGKIGSDGKFHGGPDDRI